MTTINAENIQINQQREQQQFDPWSRIYIPWLSEFIGTMLFVLFCNQTYWAYLLIITIGLFEATILIALLISFANISCCYFNPALIITSMLCLGTPLLLGISILFAQFFGAFIGALLFRSILSNTAFLDIFSHLSVLKTIERSEVLQFKHLENEENLLDNFDQFSSSPFGGRLQVFLLETFCSSIFIFSQLFPTLFRQTIIEIAISAGSARLFTCSLTFLSPLGQSGNFARTLANNLIATIFIRDENYYVWRYFHLHLFIEICSTILIAAMLFKYAKNVSANNNVELNANTQIRQGLERKIN
ncbi:hypothetical protein Mgra_00009560 [Meloidogyne graminicola]|uniref:Uncharacterized protein n=1 Tax=Meloidogyne graminicola TaxID=189291 RepID=A0A8S9ZD27_9BILA|nr:hypothetical protein Mgra_00009560 [Meloidogyne graminicola]